MNLIASNSRLAGLALLLGLLLRAGTALSAETITGTVTNGTTNKPAAGDDVILLKLAQGMQEAARTKTDARGQFTLKFPDDGAQHLVRVNHDKVNYHQPAPQGTHKVEITVYDSVPQLAGVRGDAVVYRMQVDGGQLQVAEIIAVKNESSPPKTQMGPNGFEFYIPDSAVIDRIAAGGPGGMPVNVGAIPLEPKGRYGVVFPVRPGETELEITYQMPYSGSAAFTPHITLPTENVGVLIPKSMQIKSDAPWKTTEDGGVLVYVAKNVQPEQSLAFTVSGAGKLPDMDTSGTGNRDSSAQSAAPATDNRPGGGIGVPEGGEHPLKKYMWVILSVLAILLAGGAFFVFQASPSAPAAASPATAVVATGTGGQVAVLKDILFRLETEKVQGLINEADYANTRAALDVVLRWALGKAPAAD